MHLVLWQGNFRRAPAPQLLPLKGRPYRGSGHRSGRTHLEDYDAQRDQHGQQEKHEQHADQDYIGEYLLQYVIQDWIYQLRLHDLVDIFPGDVLHQFC